MRPAPQPAHAAELAAVHALDRVRAALLRALSGSRAWKRVFPSPAARWVAAGILSHSSAALLAWHVPLLSLILGPILLGIPHLAASAFGVQRASSAPSFLKPAFALPFALVILARLLWLDPPPFIASNLRLFYAAEVAAIGAWAVLWLRSKAQGRRDPAWTRALRAAAVAALAAGFLAWPREWGAMFLLGHNAVGLIYWFLAARDGRERAAVAFNALLFAAGTLFFLAGPLLAPERVLDLQQQAFAADWSGVTLFSLGSLAMPWSSHPAFWVAGAQAWAFGQSAHYFYWLRGIPEAQSRLRIPATFRQSWAVVRQRWGRHAWPGLFLCAALLSAPFALMLLPEARVLYFSLTSVHGLVEIAGLARARAGGGARGSD